MLNAINLWNDLTKEQEQEGEEHRHDKELQPNGLSEVDGLVEAEVEDDDDGHIHQIVTDEDCGEQSFAIIEQGSHFIVGIVLAFVYGSLVVWGQAEESNLACRNKTRANEQDKYNTETNPDAKSGHLDANGTNRVDQLLPA